MQENRYKEQALQRLAMVDRKLAQVYDSVKRGENYKALRLMEEDLRYSIEDLQSVIEAERDSLDSSIGHLPS